MKLTKILAIAGIVTVLMGFTGCVRAPFVPPMGAISQVSAPLDLDYDQTVMKNSKTGEASATCILGLVSTGDASTQAAAKNGNLKTINHADYDYFNVLGIYQKTTVKVYGD